MKIYIATVSIVVFVLVAMSAMKPHDPFKNLKVLPKDITEDSLISIMENWNRSLGVTCDHCHMIDTTRHIEDYASDAKHDKQTCREMFLMTDSINRDYFPRRNPTRPLKVSCYTCHHGKARPDRQ